MTNKQARKQANLTRIELPPVRVTGNIVKAIVEAITREDACPECGATYGTFTGDDSLCSSCAE